MDRDTQQETLRHLVAHLNRLEDAEQEIRRKLQLWQDPTIWRPSDPERPVRSHIIHQHQQDLDNVIQDLESLRRLIDIYSHLSKEAPLESRVSA